MISRKPDRSTGQGLPDFPTYTIPEGAMFLGIPERTLRSWYLGKHPIFKPTVFIGDIPLLSFRDLVDAHIVQAARIYHNVPMVRIRTALQTAEKADLGSHPLQDDRIRIFARCLVHIESDNRGKSTAVTNLSRSGQGGIPQIVDQYMTRVIRDQSGNATALFPWRYWQRGERKRPLEINPDIMSGRLVVAGTRIPVSLIQAEALSKKPLVKIARDFRISVTRVKEALSHIDTKAA